MDQVILFMTQVLRRDQFLTSGPEDCEPLVEPEDFGKGGVEVEFEYVLSLGLEDCELSVDPEVFGRGGVEAEFEYVLSLGLEDCELSVDPEVFGRGGVGVDSEYDLEVRISGNMGRLEMVLTALKTVRW
jgi:hypothetical protein